MPEYQNIFAEGVNFYKPNEKAPDFIKGNIVISMTKLLDFQKTHKLDDTIRLDLKKSKEGKLYLTLNTFIATKKTAEDDLNDL